MIRDKNDEIVGLLTFSIDKGQKACELVSIDAVVKRQGIGTKLIKEFERVAKDLGVRRIWLITTNDNLGAAIFYLKMGYRLVEVHKDALKLSRKLKPEIPEKGMQGIPLEDEWEFEKWV